MPALVTENWVWDQGTDLDMDFTYAVGASSATAVAPTDFVQWSVRMDLVNTADGSIVYTFNSKDLTTPPDTNKEAVLNADGSFTITVPRSLTLPGGAVFVKMNEQPPKTSFSYDIMLRNANGSKQFKFASGTVTIEKSVTLWL